MRISKIYLSNARLKVINKTIFITWVFLGIAAFLWALLKHPPVIHLLWPLIAAYFVFVTAEKIKRDRILGPLDPKDMFGLMVFFLPLGLIELVLIILNVNEFSFWKGILPSVFIFVLWYKYGDIKLKAGCYLCFKSHPFEEEKTCPTCKKAFKDGGWVGFKAHWNQHHVAELSYDDLWGSMCHSHKKKSSLSSKSK
ncbi:hypothetical protein N9I89_04260 [Porticoccaceae bacterium]|nr:hypothetical protein [Porticoccaceae bacterium]